MVNLVRNPSSSPLTSIDPVFKHPRKFDRGTENQPYIGWLNDFGVDVCSDEGEDEGDGDDSSSDDETNNGQEDVATWEQPVENDLGSLSAVRRLMMNLGETDEPSSDTAQDDEVVRFVEHRPGVGSLAGDGDGDQLVALIDDQSDTHDNLSHSVSPHFGLTRDGLLEELKKQVSKPNQ